MPDGSSLETVGTLSWSVRTRSRWPLVSTSVFTNLDAEKHELSDSMAAREETARVASLDFR